MQVFNNTREELIQSPLPVGNVSELRKSLLSLVATRDNFKRFFLEPTDEPSVFITIHTDPLRNNDSCKIVRRCKGPLHPTTNNPTEQFTEEMATEIVRERRSKNPSCKSCRELPSYSNEKLPLPPQSKDRIIRCLDRIPKSPQTALREMREFALGLKTFRATSDPTYGGSGSDFEERPQRYSIAFLTRIRGEGSPFMYNTNGELLERVKSTSKHKLKIRKDLKRTPKGMTSRFKKRNLAGAGIIKDSSTRKTLFEIRMENLALGQLV